jgi:3D (Asp-Asp-Asp) domain-containing protein|tara:strand:- start:2470 stop:2952 length:483 start_codon:yes stop_codon:yes gene_type:complete
MKKIIRTIEIIIILLLFVQQTFSQKRKIQATIYHPVVGQTDDTPFITANGGIIDPDNPGKHRWLAVSRDLEQVGLTMGTIVCIDNAGDMNGDWIVMDRMNKRWTGKIDFLVDYSVKGGKWEDVKIQVIGFVSEDCTCGTPFYYTGIKCETYEHLKINKVN